MREITPERFDNTVSPRMGRPEKLWGAPAIAAALGVSVDKVYSLACNPAVPIYKPEGGGYFAFRHELNHWLRSKPAA